MNPNDPRLLILIKHSHPIIDPTIPSDNWRLSELGRSRCEVLAGQLTRNKPEVIVSSHEPKAVETAQIIASQLNLPYQVAEGLHEHRRNNVPFTNRGQFEEDIARFFEQPDCLVFGEETADQADLRFSTAINMLIERFPSQTLLVVAHGTVITLWVARTIGLSPFPFWKRLGLPAYVVIKLPEHSLITVVETI